MRIQEATRDFNNVYGFVCPKTYDYLLTFFGEKAGMAKHLATKISYLRRWEVEGVETATPVFRFWDENHCWYEEEIRISFQSAQEGADFWEVFDLQMAECRQEA